jgi:hypothetical protein
MFLLIFYGFVTYTIIILTMIYGWGLYPRSWWWVIGGYAAAYMLWPIIQGYRLIILKATKKAEAEK